MSTCHLVQLVIYRNAGSLYNIMSIVACILYILNPIFDFVGILVRHIMRAAMFVSNVKILFLDGHTSLKFQPLNQVAPANEGVGVAEQEGETEQETEGEQEGEVNALRLCSHKF